MVMFFLGAHHPSWLETAGVPLFVSYSTLRGRKSLPRAIAPWALDSRGFTELSTHGTWTIDPETYAADVQRYQREIGRLEWASIQDWMCEPWIIAKTGLSVEEHQRRSVASYLQLRELAPDVRWAPVLQGWTMGDYLRCVELYDEADPSGEWRRGTVGLGSVCRRQAMLRAQTIVQWLAGEGLKLHGFGFKKTGLLSSAAQNLVSADSLAWSDHARKNPQDAVASSACRLTHKSCANCLAYALQWRAELLEQLEGIGVRWAA